MAAQADLSLFMSNATLLEITCHGSYYIVSVQMVGNITCNAHVAKKIQDRESQTLVEQDGSTVAMNVYSYRKL